MIKPELFDLVELLVDLPEHNLIMGEQGTIVEDYNDGCYEIEFSNDLGETIALCSLPMQQFIVIWKAQNKTWLSLTEKLTALIDKLPKEKQQKVLDFTRSLYQ
ncbi:hypothetical protein N0824_03665 [Microcystis sp. 0824]|jgi:hypothetical protein|uniref:DUF4926 domain-containing protein n=14 Tax=Microcystis TaxID=1125 RepID=A0A0F6RN44_MICAE|nr:MULTISPECIES: DUF4926 domain-containing protein [Microcystis]MCZ8056283.1 DUF4926 domain-containing protein [Microcystis sp. LE19-12.2C]MCZ8129215.1 DUF4926 domain-containing protein [Microcystis sp. LE19-114.1B]MCZ8189606.1 DUF4926 domain-containing protein [Microcystis sp. LE19-338.1B]MCZ8358173.1 DUF4926 domain-containing protein [Microcystis sp. LE19-388.1G]MDJ0548039.1 DUF4926 domain-containing protein [Microcystis sp. M49637_WE12]MDJ0558297.1 DUF4926 domain-containing protein [Microc